MRIKNLRIYNKKRFFSLITACVLAVTLGVTLKNKSTNDELVYASEINLDDDIISGDNVVYDKEVKVADEIVVEDEKDSDYEDEDYEHYIFFKECYGVVNVDKLNVRSSCYILDDNIVGIIKKSDEVFIVGLTESGWYLIEYNDGLYYVKNEFINIIKEEEHDLIVQTLETKKRERDELISSIKGKIHTIADRVNVRTGPSTESEVLGICKKNVELSYIEYESGWYKIVNSKGQVGYISGEYVSKNGFYHDDFLCTAVCKEECYVYDKNGNSISIIDECEIVEVIDIKDKIVQVRYYDNKTNKGNIGYMEKKYLVKLSSMYLDVDISSQKLRVCDGVNIYYECDIVTGNNETTPTPVGERKVLDKKKNYVMNGTNLDGTMYSAATDYAISIGDGFYFHNLSGKSINTSKTAYLNGKGSHGCIRVPLSDIKYIYSMVDKNDKVIIHR